MMRRYVTLITVMILTGMATPALAEPNFDGLGEALMLFAISIIAYLAVAIWLILLMVRGHWRSFWLVLGGAFTVSIIVPVVDSMRLVQAQHKVKQAEIIAEAPDLGKKSVLLVTATERCFSNICGGLFALQDGAALWTLSPQDLEQSAQSGPLDLATLPLRQFAPHPEDPQVPVLQDAPDDAVRPAFDYVVFARAPFYRSRAGSFEAMFPQIPDDTGLGDRLVLSSLAAPIDGNMLHLSALEPDRMTFYIAKTALAPPLFPENKRYAVDRGWEWRRAVADWFCGSRRDPDRSPAQMRCSREMD